MSAHRHLALSACALSALLVECRAPTAIRIGVYSEAPCESHPSVGISVASTLDALSAAGFESVSTTCTPEGGFAGSLVLAPKGSKSEALVVAVVTQIAGKDPATCVPAHAGAGCIEARRSFRFSPHDEVDVRIDMRLSCVDVTCDVNDTCVRGNCVPADVPITTCSGECDERTLPPPTGARDAGVDATVAPADDGGAETDAAIDAGATSNVLAATKVSASGPSARDAAQAAFDPKRNVTVVSAGRDATGAVLDDIWEWNGTTWFFAASATTIARWGGGAAFDPNRGAAVFFGGDTVADPAGARSNAATAWNGSTFVDLNQGVAPSARSELIFTRAPADAGELLFGGRPSAELPPIASPYILGSTGWTSLAGGSLPSARYGAGAAFDESRNVVVLFGGVVPNVNGLEELSRETWEWDGSAWSGGATPGIFPRGLVYPQMVYDAGRKRVLLLGGDALDGTSSNDAWAWDGTSWAAVTVTDGPTARSRPAVVYDSARSEIVMFGGRVPTIDVASGETWIFK